MCGARPAHPPRTLKALAEADAFRSLGLERREALWKTEAIKSSKPLPLFADLLEGEGIVEDKVELPAMTEGEEVVEDYVATRLTLRTHPLALLRDVLTPPDEARQNGGLG